MNALHDEVAAFADRISANATDACACEVIISEIARAGLVRQVFAELGRRAGTDARLLAKYDAEIADGFGPGAMRPNLLQ